MNCLAGSHWSRTLPRLALDTFANFTVRRKHVGGCHNRSTPTKKKLYTWRISLPPEFHAMLLLSSSSFVLSPLSLFYFPLFRLPPTPPTACSQWPTGRELCPLHPEASFKFQQCQWVELRDLGQLGGWDHHDQRPSAVELDPHPEGRRSGQGGTISGLSTEAEVLTRTLCIQIS